MLISNGTMARPLASGRCKIGQVCIAVIEDELEVAALLRDILEGEGYVVLTLLGPDLFEPGALHMEPDVFVIDMMLPGVDGITVAEHLRHDGYSEIPMIALSASRAWCYAAVQSQLFQDTLSKPFDMSELLEAVARLVRA